MKEPWCLLLHRAVKDPFPRLQICSWLRLGCSIISWPWSHSTPSTQAKATVKISPTEKTRVIKIVRADYVTLIGHRTQVPGVQKLDRGKTDSIWKVGRRTQACSEKLPQIEISTWVLITIRWNSSFSCCNLSSCALLAAVAFCSCWQKQKFEILLVDNWAPCENFLVN